MRRQFIWMQAALCAVTFSIAAPVLARADQPAHAHAHGKNKPKKSKQAKQAKGHDWDQRFHGLDRNHNNVVSRAEWNGDDRSFANHDWNRDGVLSGDELVAGATRPDAARAVAPRVAVPRTTAPRTARPNTEPDEVLFARMDSNRDERLSRNEWTGSASDFARLDFNKDGVLSPYEFGVGR
jgi:hypothetical protein